MGEKSQASLLLTRIRDGDRLASESLFPLVYEELKQLAQAKLNRESAGQTLQATALVHEAFLRMLGPEAQSPQWDDLGHFFGAASQAMRRILIDRARQKGGKKQGGGMIRQAIEEGALSSPLSDAESPELLLALEEAMTALALRDPMAEELVRLRFFAGLTVSQAAECIGISERSAHRLWQFARTWLLHAMTAN
ncbi:MAG: sigma-70 family RNA polymerase sigma factor [Planctomycetes bacterium]|nr:sigma-70 family RNA polymerase sigma factor [Planctomycetota bacterium]